MTTAGFAESDIYFAIFDSNKTQVNVKVESRIAQVVRYIFNNERFYICIIPDGGKVPPMRGQVLALRYLPNAYWALAAASARMS